MTKERFPRELRALLKRRRLSAVQLSVRLHKAHSTVYEWLNGKYAPDFLEANGLARILRWPEVVAIVEADVADRKHDQAGQADAAAVFA